MNMKLIDRIKALKKRDKYVLSAIANLTWYCVAGSFGYGKDCAGQPDGRVVLRVDS